MNIQCKATLLQFMQIKFEESENDESHNSLIFK